MSKQTNIKENLESVISAIQNSVDVKKIYLFGSYTDNTYTDDSDLDLCIVASLAGLRKIDILRKIRKAMMKDVDMPVDLLVYDDAEFHKIAHEGVVLYEQ